jgi:hypothetical protein
MRASSVLVQKAGSRPACRFTSIPHESQTVGFLSGQKKTLQSRVLFWPELESNQRHKDFQS